MTSDAHGDEQANAGQPAWLSALPIAANAYVSSDEVEWREAKPGVFSKELLNSPDDGQRVVLARLLPGAYSPPHSHTELEHIYILEGGFHDGERWLGVGDYCVRAPGVEHTATTEQGALTLVVYTPDPRA